MVEYAILLILLVTLLVGGTELGITALASSKNTEAAQTGISEYAEVNQRRLNILNTEKQYLISLSSYGCIQITDSGACDSAGTKDNFIKYLDDVYINDGDFNDVITHLQSLIDDNPSTNSPSEALLTISSIEDLLEAEAELSVSIIPSGNNEEGQLKYKALLLISHYKLSQLPLLTDTDNDSIDDKYLSQASINIGVIDGNIAPASCNGNTYNYGFPNGRYPYNNDDAEDVYVKTSGGQLYLFHPLPIDVSSCAGTDDERDGKPRLRILIDGYTPTNTKLAATGKTFEELFVPGLPKLNQAMYSNYENVCVNSNSSYVSCSSPNVAQRWLKPPGKICFSNTEIAGVDSCIGQPNADAITGFYYFANANDGARFEYTQNDDDKDGDGNSDFRPAMQIECSPTPDKNLESVFDDQNCDGTQSKVRIHTRYRRVFEGFLTFGLMTLTNTNLLPYFYNPSQVGGAEHVVVGSHGSEVGPLGRGGNPTIKHFMDFRGCYEVDVETNQVSACN